MTDKMREVKVELAKKDMTFSDLAKEIGVSRQAIWLSLSGKYDMPRVNEKIMTWLKGERK